MGIESKNGIVALNAVRKLRINKLSRGTPFMIFSTDLPTRHAYLEYPEGKIVVVTVNKGEHDFTVVRELSGEENAMVRHALNLDRITP